MEEQQIISNQNLKKKIGKTFDVLIEDVSFDGKYFIGRTMQDVPEIDGIVYIKNIGQDEDKMLNKIEKYKVIDISDYDLIME